MHCNLNFRKAALFIVIPALLLIVTSVFFVACKKGNNNDLNNVDDQGGYASDGSRVEWVTDDAISIADAAGEVYNGAYMRTTHTTVVGTCCTVGTDTTGTQRALVIRFGTDDCVCLDGRKRRGTIIVKYYGEYTDPSQLHTITFDNYFINDNQLTGSITTTRVDTTITGNWYYKVTVNDSLNMSPDPYNSQFIVWNGHLVRKWVTGYTTGDRGDDVFSISGSANLTRPNSHVFTFDIATPLQVALDCNYCQSGVVDISGLQGARILNYGTGTCDPLAQLNIGVHVYQLTLVP